MKKFISFNSRKHEVSGNGMKVSIGELGFLMECHHNLDFFLERRERKEGNKKIKKKRYLRLSKTTLFWS